MAKNSRRRSSIVTRNTQPWAKLIRSDENTVVGKFFGHCLDSVIRHFSHYFPTDIKFGRVECRSRKDEISSWRFKKTYSTTVTFHFGYDKENIDASLQRHFTIERKEQESSEENLNPAILTCTGGIVHVNEEILLEGQSRILVHQDAIALKSLQKKFTFMDWRQNNQDKYSYEVQSQFYIEKQLGEEGTSGPVRLAHDVLTLEKFAIKSIDFQGTEEVDGLNYVVSYLERAKNEIAIMRQLEHPNIVKLMKTIWDPARVHLFVEFMDGGDLFHYVTKPPNRRMEEGETKFAMNQICEGLKYLHDKNIAHGDIKLENIFMKTRNNVIIYKIGDFGLSAVDYDLTRKEGTLPYLAPELLDHHSSIYSGRRCDMWAIGVLIYACISGGFPFDIYNVMIHT